MELSEPSESPEQPVREKAAAIDSDFIRKFDELTRWDTTGECVGGTGIAMAVYSVLAVGFWLAYFDNNILIMLIAWLPLVIIGFLFGAFSAIAVTALAYPVNATVGNPLGALAFNFVVSGLAGFLPFIFPLSGAQFSDGELSLFIATGPFAAMFLCHIVSYWLTRRTIDAHNERGSTVPYQPEGKIFWSSKFTIKHLMIFTVWIAGGFALLSTLPHPFRWQVALVYVSAQIPAAVLSAAFLWFLYKFKRKKKATPPSSV